MDGSSPRLRGTDVQSMITQYAERFIPAPAGNSWERAVGSTRIPVHPRACGEQPLLSAPDSSSNGSSPRLRGTELQCLIRNEHRRFIPAPAGNSTSIPPTMSIFPVHPRACGEQ